MASEYEQLPLEPINQHSFEDQLRDSFDTPKLERLSHTLVTPASDFQASQQELQRGSLNAFSTNTRKINNSVRVRSAVSGLGSCLTVLNNWWWWEIGSILLSISCVVAIIIVLSVIHEKPLSAWRFPIAPNALISIFVTASKASLMLSVAACISQMKWLYFKHGTHRLDHLELFDEASRGPLGALELLTGIWGGRSKASWAATWGSAITIVALAVDPFAQQILSFPSRQTLLNLGSASINSTQIYDTGNEGGFTNSETKNVDVSMQGAIMNGMYSLDSPVNFNCQTGNCTWPTFHSLGICSTCTNVTGQVKSSCILSPGGKSCNYTMPNGFVLTGRLSESSGGGSWTTINATAEAKQTSEGSNITNTLTDIAIVKIDQWVTMNGTVGTMEQPEALECSITWCAKVYHEVAVSNGRIDTSHISEFSLHSLLLVYSGVDGRQYSPLRVADNTSGFDGNRTFTVNLNDHRTIAQYLATLFTTSNQDATARALWTSPNISQIMSNIATSMTNNIRESTNAIEIKGSAALVETYIHVSWAWLTLLMIVVLMSVVLVVVSVVMSTTSGTKLWKSSSLALVFSKLEGWEDNTLRANSITELQEVAKRMRGRLENEGAGGPNFVRN